jgi:hypothetical protein
VRDRHVAGQHDLVELELLRERGRDCRRPVPRPPQPGQPHDHAVGRAGAERRRGLAHRRSRRLHPVALGDAGAAGGGRLRDPPVMVVQRALAAGLADVEGEDTRDRRRAHGITWSGTIGVSMR